MLLRSNDGDARPRLVVLLATALVVGAVANCVAAQPDYVARDWRAASFVTIADLVSFLNTPDPASGEKVAELKIVAMAPTTPASDAGGISIRYRRAPGVDFPWQYRRYTSAADVLDFLNGTPKSMLPNKPGFNEWKPQTAVRDFAIHALWNSATGSAVFHMLVQPAAPREKKAKWYQISAASYDGMVDKLNGGDIGKARITSVLPTNGGSQPGAQFIAFCQQRDASQAVRGWSATLLAEDDPFAGPVDRITVFLNRRRTSVTFDNKSVAAVPSDGLPRYVVFQPEGFLVFTRNTFLPNPTLAEFREWKFRNGFDFYADTADSLPQLSDLPLIERIRNRLRDYHRNAGIRYVLMVGDSVQEPQRPDKLPCGAWWAPPAATLSEDWNLPLGYYMAEYTTDCLPPVNDSVDTGTVTISVSTSLFYADVTNGMYYGSSSYWAGSYEIYVGMAPVRDDEGLSNVLRKTMTTPIPELMTWFVDPAYITLLDLKPFFETIQGLAGGRLTISELGCYWTDSATTLKDVFLGTPGILQTWAHGNTGGFELGSAYIRPEDALDFKQVNPLFIDGAACYGPSYYQGTGWDREFLAAPGGPAAISPTPFVPNSKGFLQPRTEYYAALLEGLAVGRAFYDYANGSVINSDVLFGDPSLVVVKHRPMRLIR